MVIDWHDEAPESAYSDDLLFYATSQNPPVGELSPNTVLVNVNGGNDNDTVDVCPQGRTERWLYRLWPSGTTDCQSTNGGYWTQGVNKQYTFVATNCVDWDHTFQPPTHSPDPLFVDPLAKPVLPRAYTEAEWGTRTFPFHRLDAALARASPMVTLVVKASGYQLSAPGAPFLLDRPLVLTADGGAVELR